VLQVILHICFVQLPPSLALHFAETDEVSAALLTVSTTQSCRHLDQATLVTCPTCQANTTV
jgi:hypothetical protein